MSINYIENKSKNCKPAIVVFGISPSENFNPIRIKKWASKCFSSDAKGKFIGAAYVKMKFFFSDFSVIVNKWL